MFSVEEKSLLKTVSIGGMNVIRLLYWSMILRKNQLKCLFLPELRYQLKY